MKPANTFMTNSEFDAWVKSWPENIESRKDMKPVIWLKYGFWRCGMQPHVRPFETGSTPAGAYSAWTQARHLEQRRVIYV